MFCVEVLPWQQNSSKEEQWESRGTETCSVAAALLLPGHPASETRTAGSSGRKAVEKRKQGGWLAHDDPSPWRHTLPPSLFLPLGTLIWPSRMEGREVATSQGIGRAAKHCLYVHPRLSHPGPFLHVLSLPVLAKQYIPQRLAAVGHPWPPPLPEVRRPEGGGRANLGEGTPNPVGPWLAMDQLESQDYQYVHQRNFK